jgi:hypothetical protein
VNRHTTQKTWAHHRIRWARLWFGHWLVQLDDPDRLLYRFPAGQHPVVPRGGDRCSTYGYQPVIPTFDDEPLSCEHLLIGECQIW